MQQSTIATVLPKVGMSSAVPEPPAKRLVMPTGRMPATERLTIELLKPMPRMSARESGQAGHVNHYVIAAQERDHGHTVPHSRRVAQVPEEGGQPSSVPHVPHAASPLDALHAQIAHHARQYLDLQKLRIATNNRIKKLEARYPDDALFLDLAGGQMGALTGALADKERTLAHALERYARQHPLASWVQQARGIGLLGFALLLGVTGPLDQFATPAKLWKYVGMDVRPDGRAPRKQRGQKLGYAPQGRVLCHQLGESIVKVGAGGPYRAAYDTKKADYLARPRTGPSECPFGQTHAEASGAIIKCGLAHAHNAAMRYATKRLLRDLWVEWHRQ
jgi:hypothetical protein